MTLNVTTLQDEDFNDGDTTAERNDGDGLSLREALALNASGVPGQISFDSSLANSTVFLTAGPLFTGVDTILNGDANTDGLGDIRVQSDIGTPVLIFNTGDVDFTNELTALLADGTATFESRGRTILIDADDVTFTNSGDILSIGSSAFSSQNFYGVDESTAVEVLGDGFTFVNNMNASVISAGRVGVGVVFDENGTAIDTNIINNGLIEAQDDAIRVLQGTVENNGIIRATGYDSNFSFSIPGATSDAIQTLGELPPGFTPDPAGLLHVTNNFGGVIEGARSGIFMSGGGSVTNAGTIHADVAAIAAQSWFSPGAPIASSFDLVNSGTISRGEASYGFNPGTQIATVMIAGDVGGLSNPTITNSGTIWSPDLAISSDVGVEITNTLMGLIDSNSGTAFRGGSAEEYAVRAVLSSPQPTPDLLSSQDVSINGSGELDIDGAAYAFQSNLAFAVYFVRASDPFFSLSDVAGILPLIDIVATQNQGRVIYQLDGSGNALFAPTIEVVSAEFGTLTVNYDLAGGYRSGFEVLNSDGDTFLAVPSVLDFDDVINNNGIIVGDILTGLGDDIVTNTGSIDGSVDLGEGDDIYDGTGSSGFMTVDGGAGVDTITAGSGGGHLRGGDGNDILNGGDGNDILNGGDGNDTLEGGAGLDTLNGGGGDDILIHSTRESGVINYLNGDAGNDTFRVSAEGALIIDGGAGYDTVEYSSQFNLNGGSLTNVEEFEFQPGSRLYMEAGLLNDVDLISQNGSFSIFIQLTTSGITDLSHSLEAGAFGLIRGDFPGSNVIDVTGATGDWTLSGGAEVDTLTGGLGDDSLFGNLSGDHLFGGAGEDALYGQAGHDHLYGEDGDDTLLGGDGNDVLIGGAGADFMHGGDNILNFNYNDFDIVSYENAASGVTASLQTLTGNRGDAAGDTYADIEALRGSDFDDVLVGNDGLSDQLFGGWGNDSLRGNSGDDFVYGEGGNDLIFAGLGADTIDGGAGIDTLMLTQAAAGVIVQLDLGTGAADVAAGDSYANIENVAGSAFGDELHGDDGINFLDGRGGDDLLIGNGGADVLDGGDGFDIVSYANSGTAVSVSLFLGSGPGNDIIRNVEHVVGSNFNDLLVGNDGVDDTLDGGDGNDNLRGNGGNDALNGGGGNDILFSGFGNDAHDGGGGFDTINYSQASAGVIVRLDLGAGTLGHAQGDTYANIENITGSSAFRDLLYGNDIGNIIDGRGGNDLLIGNGGSDTLIGGNGFDKLDGGTGFDVLTGGAGDDTFVFEAGYRIDRITDFSIGEDQVDLTSFGFTTYSQVSSLMYTSGADTVLTFGGGDAIRLVGISLGDLDASDFIITAPPGNAPAEKAEAPNLESFDIGADIGLSLGSSSLNAQEAAAGFLSSNVYNSQGVMDAAAEWGAGLTDLDVDIFGIDMPDDSALGFII